jgi:hypothetical protein
VSGPNGTVGGYGLVSAYQAAIDRIVTHRIVTHRIVTRRIVTRRIVIHRCERGLAPRTDDTGDDCRSRAKFSEPALRDLSREIAGEVEERADPDWL